MIAWYRGRRGSLAHQRRRTPVTAWLLSGRRGPGGRALRIRHDRLVQPRLYPRPRGTRASRFARSQAAPVRLRRIVNAGRIIPCRHDNFATPSTASRIRDSHDGSKIRPAGLATRGGTRDSGSRRSPGVVDSGRSVSYGDDRPSTGACKKRRGGREQAQRDNGRQSRGQREHTICHVRDSSDAPG